MHLLSTALSTWLSTGVQLLLQYIYGILKGLILLQLLGNFVDAVDDGGVVLLVQALGNGCQRRVRHIAAQIHGNLPGTHNLLVSSLGHQVR